MTKQEQVLARLEALADRLERALATTGPTQPPTDPAALEAAEKMLKDRKWHRLREAGIDPPYDEA